MTLKLTTGLILFFALTTTFHRVARCQPSPEKINFVRQGVQRMLFDDNQSIHLAGLNPGNVIGPASMHPVKQYATQHSALTYRD